MLRVFIPDELANKYNAVYEYACRTTRRLERVVTLPHWPEWQRDDMVDQLLAFAKCTRPKLLELDIMARRDAEWTERLEEMRPPLIEKVNAIKRLASRIDSIPVRAEAPATPAEHAWASVNGV
jgi:hypothetical protein